MRLAAIDLLLRWSKEVLCIVLGLNLVAFTISDEPISYIELTFEKIVQTLVIIERAIL